MTKRHIIPFILALIFFSGCTVFSFYPLYTDDVLKTDHRIVGNWLSLTNDPNKTDTIIWEITFKEKMRISNSSSPFKTNDKEVPNKFTYTLNTYSKTNPDDKALFELHLVELEGEYYLDFFPDEWESKNDILFFHLMGVHTFAKVEIGESIKLNWLDPEWLEKLIENDKIRIKHETNDTYTILTAKSRELQKFMTKYSNDTTAYKDGLEYILKRI